MAVFQYNTATTAPGARTVINAAFASHAAYTLIEEFAPTTNITVYVWRNSGATNGTGRDFHIILWLDSTATAPTLLLGVAEGYDITTRSVIRPVPNSADTTVKTTTPAADGSYGGGTSYLLGTAATPPGHLLFATIASGTANAGIWCLVSQRGLQAWTKTAAPAFNRFSAMVFDTFLGADDPMPLLLHHNGTSGTSRHPFVTAAGSGNWWIHTAQSVQNWTPMAGTVGGAGDRFYNNRPLASRRFVAHSIQSPSIYGAYRGLFWNALHIATDDTKVLIGDTMIVNGDTYMWTGANSLWLMSSAP